MFIHNVLIIHLQKQKLIMHDNIKYINKLIERVYRENYSKILSVLLRTYGSREIDLAESAIQEAFLRAIKNWAENKIPPNPIGWIIIVAKNYLIDNLRQRKKHKEQEDDSLGKASFKDSNEQESTEFDFSESIDDQLKLIFMCCHPSLKRRAQICLTLKIVGGFKTREISRAFLSNVEATRKLITRAKQKIKEDKIPFEFPAAGELPSRLDSVLDVIYLIFNEGYSAYEGEKLVREELCEEAIRLCYILLDEKFLNLPKIPSIKALLSLLLLQSSRLPARTDENGNIITLEKQDRTKWDKERIKLGVKLLHESASGDKITSFHLQAKIASYHAISPSYEQAEWDKISISYDQLVELNPSPVVLLNRAVAIFHAIGEQAAINELKNLENEPLLKNYNYFYATYADFYLRMNKKDKAKQYLEKAIDITKNIKERHYLELQLSEC